MSPLCFHLAYLIFKSCLSQLVPQSETQDKTQREGEVKIDVELRGDLEKKQAECL